MKITLEFESLAEAKRAMFADVAWSIINEALEAIRNHQKHNVLSQDDLIDMLRSELLQARGVLEQA